MEIRTYGTKKILIADEGKVLENAITKVQLKSVVIAEKDVENWSEVE